MICGCAKTSIKSKKGSCSARRTPIFKAPKAQTRVSDNGYGPKKQRRPPPRNHPQQPPQKHPPPNHPHKKLPSAKHSTPDPKNEPPLLPITTTTNYPAKPPHQENRRPHKHKFRGRLKPTAKHGQRRRFEVESQPKSYKDGRR